MRETACYMYMYVYVPLALVVAPKVIKEKTMPSWMIYVPCKKSSKYGKSKDVQELLVFGKS